MSLDKFLKKSKSSKKTDTHPDNESVIEEEKAIKEIDKSVNDKKIDQELENATVKQENDVTISYDDLLVIIKQIPSYTDYLTETIWILEDGSVNNIEEFLKKHYDVSDIFIKVLLKEAKKIISDKKTN